MREAADGRFSFTPMFLSLSFSLPSPISTNKYGENVSVGGRRIRRGPGWKQTWSSQSPQSAMFVACGSALDSDVCSPPRPPGPFVTSPPPPYRVLFPPTASSCNSPSQDHQGTDATRHTEVGCRHCHPSPAAFDQGRRVGTKMEQ